MPNWNYWKNRNYYHKELRKRALMELPEMEAAKSVVRHVARVYGKGDKILDVGCGSGHFIPSIERVIGPEFEYMGIDITPGHIEIAKEVFGHRQHCSFKIGDIRGLEMADDCYDIVICSNTIPHIPNIQKALTEIIRVVSKVAIVRMLVGTETLITKKALSKKLDENGEPKDFMYVNIFSEEFLFEWSQSMGLQMVIHDDEFDPVKIQAHYERHKADAGHNIATRIVESMQFKGNLLLPWKIIEFTK